jgi:serine/threonine protein kinase
MSQDIGELKKVERLGRGAFSEVFCYEHRKTRYRVAVKIMALKGSDDLKKRISREVHIHRMLRHENIVQLFAPIISDEYAYIMMEICEGGTLSSHVRKQEGRRLALEEVRFLFFQMAAAVEYIHTSQIVHRDIKPSNFLLRADLHNIKLTDFGLAAQIEPGEIKHTACGSPNFMAPEIIGPKVTKRGEKSFYGQAVDIWSLGCCFYFMLVGYCPFDRRSLEATFKAIRDNSQNPIPLQIFIGFDDHSAVLMDQMLTTNPSQRISAREILEHDFFKCLETY